MPPRKAKDDTPPKPLSNEERGGPVEKAGEAVESGDNGGENKGTDQGTTEAAAGDGKVDAAEGTDIERPTDQSAFDARIERLSRIAEEAEFDSGTLVGDIRDLIVDLYKSRPKPWSQMSSGDQRDIYRAAEDVAKKVLRKLVIVVAEEDEISVHAKLNGYSADGETFKLKATVQADEETALQLFRLDGHEVVILSADATRFTGQRRDPAVMPDQGALEFADGQGKGEAEPEHPADDSDLAEAGSQAEEARTRINVGIGMFERKDESGAWVVDRPASPAELAAEDTSSTWRVNLKTGLIERLPQGADGDAEGSWEDVREATPEELAAERERNADFEA